MRTKFLASALLGVILGSFLAVGVEAQGGPYSAQIQRALNAFVGAAHTWTALQTFSGGTAITGPSSADSFCLDSTNKDIYLGRIGANDLGFYTNATNCATGTLRFEVSASMATSLLTLQGANLQTPSSGYLAILSRLAFQGGASDGLFKLTQSDLATGVGVDVSTASTIRFETAAFGDTAIVRVATFNATTGYQVGGVPGVGFAVAHALPADQTGNATSTLKMNGLGAAGAPCTITPTSTGRVLFVVSGDLTNSVILDGVSFKLVYGTGAAPANAAAATGTTISALRGPAAPVAAQKQGFSIQGIATGLSLVATWFDLQVADVTGGTASISNVTCDAHEM